MFLPEIFNLGKAFKQYFEIVPACSDELKDEVYRIRHQVYCEELKWEAARPNRRENDEHDPHSLHLLIRSVKIGEFMGCTRLVLTPREAPGKPLPFEKACAATLDRSVVDPSGLPRESIGEFGRLAVLRKFRNRKGEEKSATGLIQSFNSLMRLRCPYILAGLYLGTIELARLNRIDTLFILTEMRLVRQLRRLGVKIQPIGDPVEHRGQRFPSMLSASSVIENLGVMVRPLYRTISEEIERGLPTPISSAGRRNGQVVSIAPHKTAFGQAATSMQGVVMFEKLIVEEYLEWDKTHKRAISYEMEEAILKAIAHNEALPEEWKGHRDGVGFGNAIYFERSRCIASNPISREETVTITSIYYDFQ